MGYKIYFTVDQINLLLKALEDSNNDDVKPIKKAIEEAVNGESQLHVSEWWPEDFK